MDEGKHQSIRSHTASAGKVFPTTRQVDDMTDILFVTSYLGQGGAERVSSSLANELSNQGHKLTYATFSKKLPNEYSLDDRVHRIELDLMFRSSNILSALKWNFIRIRALRTILRKKKPALVISFLDSTNLQVLIASLGMPVKVVISERNFAPNLPMVKSKELARKYLYYFSDVLVVQTARIKDWALEETRSRDIRVIPNWVNYPLPQVPPQIPPPDNERHIILAVGRDSPLKGFNRLLDIFMSVADSIPDWDLYIVGPDPDSSLSATIGRSAFSDRVKIPGRAGNISDWYHSADIFVMTSLTEGFPNVLIEAMSHKLPAICFDIISGPSELIEHEVNGLLIPDDDHALFAASLERLALNKNLREDLGRNASAVLDKYSKDQIMKQWSDIVRDITLCVE